MVPPRELFYLRFKAFDESGREFVRISPTAIEAKLPGKIFIYLISSKLFTNSRITVAHHKSGC